MASVALISRVTTGLCLPIATFPEISILELKDASPPTNKIPLKDIS